VTIGIEVPRRRVAIAGGLLALALLLGGGGSPNPMAELWLQTLATFAALAWIWWARRGSAPIAADPAFWLLAAIPVLLPLLQLVPLPPALWSGLPGRAVTVDALGLIGHAESWRPLTLSPPETLAALLSLGPPLAVMLMAAALDPSGRRWLIAVVVALALASALVGAIQLAGGSAAPRFYSQTHMTGITGFQANRNAEADVLLIGLAGLGVLAGSWRAAKGRVWWFAGLAALLGLAVIFTGSRTGIALLPAAMAAACLAWCSGPFAPRLRPMAAAAGAGALLLALAALLVWSPALGWVAERFGRERDARAELWADGWFATGQYWPLGSGMGTFEQSILAAERLEFVDASTPHRAHNDFLELALEAGIPGLAGLLLAALLLAMLALKAWRRRPGERAQTVFAIGSLALLGLHSLVDYPLRSMSLACLAALAAGLLAAPPDPSRAGGGQREGDGQGGRRAPRRDSVREVEICR